jgi:predicted DNA binding CopG/RHH family protein
VKKEKYLKIRISGESLELLKKAQKKSGIETFSAFIRDCLRKIIENLKAEGR